MVRIRKVTLQIVGGLQCILGGFASVFAYFLYTSDQIQNALFLTIDEVFLSSFLLLAFSIFSIGSGVLLLNEKEGNY